MGRAVGLRNDRGQGNAWQRLPWSPAQRYPSRRARPLPPPGGTPGRQDTRSGSMQHSEPPQDLVAVDVDVASAPARGVRHGAGVAAEDAGDGAGVGGLLLVKAGELRQGRARCRVSGAWGDGHWHRFGGGVCPARWGACAAQAAPRATEAVRTEAGALLARRAAPHVHAPARPHAAETNHFLCFAKRQQATNWLAPVSRDCWYALKAERQAIGDAAGAVRAHRDAISLFFHLRILGEAGRRAIEGQDGAQEGAARGALQH